MNGYIWSSIRDLVPFGNAALAQLCQHFEHWDGDGWDVTRPIELTGSAESDSGDVLATTDDKRRKGKLCLALKYMDDSWQMQVYVASDQLPSGRVQFRRDEQDWSAQLIDSLGGPVSRAGANQQYESLDGRWLAANDHYAIDGVWSEEGAGEQSIVLRSFNRTIRVFNWHSETTLVEKPALPGEGDAYLLVHNSIELNWHAWVRDLPAAVEINSALPRQGIPAEWKFVYVNGLAAVDDNHWAHFPDGGAADRRRPRVLRLVGGSRARRTGLARPYLQYDPPKVVLEAEAGTTLTILTGAELDDGQQVTPIIPGHWPRPQSICCTYGLLPHEHSSYVVVVAKRGEAEVARVAFSLVRNAAEIEAAPHGDFRLNRLGEPLRLEGEGVRGSTAPAVNDDWNFEDGPAFDWLPFDLTEIRLPSFQFLEWLAVRGRVPFPRARDQLARFASLASPAAVLKTLCRLGHLDIQTDNRGRWAYVHASPPTLYPLPNTVQGRIQAVVSGAVTQAQLCTILEVASALGIENDSGPQFGSGQQLGALVPSRVCLLTKDLESLAEVANRCHLAWDSSPAAFKIASWVGSIDDWSQALSWYLEAGPQAESTYNGMQFRFTNGNSWPQLGNEKLGRFVDPVTQQHCSFTLVRRNGGIYHHAFVTQKEWGCWSAYRSLLDAANLKAQQIPIAFEPRSQAVVVPLALEPPMLLSRALTLCSGLAPHVIKSQDFAAYAAPGNQLVAGPAYIGSCLAYKYVPRALADAILGRIGAECREVPLRFGESI